MTSTALYDDGGLLLDEEGVTIRRYYFPWAGAKPARVVDLIRAHVNGPEA